MNEGMQIIKWWHFTMVHFKNLYHTGMPLGGENVFYWEKKCFGFYSQKYSSLHFKKMKSFTSG